MFGFAPALAAPGTPSVPVQENILSEYAGTSLRLFDPFAGDAVESFTEFLRLVPMQNHRPVPAAVARETRSAFAFMYSAAHPVPTYFVGTYFDKTTISPLMVRHREQIIEKYGEEVLPQRTCPVFATQAQADVPGLLSTATGLSAEYFRDAPGNAGRLHEIFLLTETSHCGFLARYRQLGDLLESLSSMRTARMFIEAIGDYEAIAAYRELYGESDRIDEGDILEAARIITMFLSDRTTAYTYIPALTATFERHGIEQGAREISEVEQDVNGAREAFREMTVGATTANESDLPERLSALASRVSSQLGAESPSVQSPYRHQLLNKFPEAVAILTGKLKQRGRSPHPGSIFITLPGVPRSLTSESPVPFSPMAGQKRRDIG